MPTYKKSAWIPILVSLVVSLGVAAMLWVLKDSPTIEHVLTLTLQVSLAIFVFFVVYFIVALISLRFQVSIWPPGLSSALIIYFGAIIIMLAYFQEFVEKMAWDVGLAGLGVVAVTIGMAFLPRYEQPPLEETLKDLKKHSSLLEDAIAAFNKTQNNLEGVMDSALKETQKFLESLNKLLEKSKSKK